MNFQKYAIVCIAMGALCNVSNSYCDEAAHNIYQNYTDYNPFELTDDEFSTINSVLDSCSYKEILFGEQLSNLINNTMTGKNLHENTGLIFGKGEELGIFDDYMECFEILSMKYDDVKNSINNKENINQINNEMNIIKDLYKKTFDPIEFQINTESKFVKNIPENYKEIIAKVASKNFKSIAENYEIQYKGHLRKILKLIDNLQEINNKYLNDYKELITYQINNTLYKKGTNDCNIM